VLNATYDDPQVQNALPFAEELRQAVTQAKSRPVSPVYPQISQAIYKNVNEALAWQRPTTRSTRPWQPSSNPARPSGPARCGGVGERQRPH
jgi:hypothetical protein